MKLKMIMKDVYRVTEPQYTSRVLIINDYDGEMDALKRRYWYMVADAEVIHRADTLQDLADAIDRAYKTQDDIRTAKALRKGANR